MAQNHIFKITFRQQRILLTPAVLTWVGLIILVKFYLKLSIYDSAGLIVFPFLFIIDTLPTIILHIQYWIKNHGAIISIDTEKKNISFEKGPIKIEHSFNDISRFQYFRTYGKGSGWNSFGMYRYYKIIFIDGTEVNITCLMINDIEHTLEILLGIKAEKQFKLLCLVR